MLLPLKFDFTLTVEDFKASTRVFYAKQPVVWIGLFLAAVFFVYGIVLVFTGGQESLTTAFLTMALFPVLLYIYFVRSPAQMGNQIARVERFTAPQKWSVDEDEILVSQEAGDTRVNWSEFVGVVEGRGYFLLRFAANRNAFQIIPKRAFSSEQQLADFTELLVKKLALRRGKAK